MNIHIAIIAMIIVCPLKVFSAVRPMSPKELKESSDLVVTGKVIGVSSKISKSKVEKSLGIHRDKIFKVIIKVKTVVKGKGIKVGQDITIRAWQPSVRVPPIPGPQGNVPMPNRGDSITAYLHKQSDNNYSALLPNGFKINNK